MNTDLLVASVILLIVRLIIWCLFWSLATNREHCLEFTNSKIARNIRLAVQQKEEEKKIEKKFVRKKGTVPQMKERYTEKHFTLMGFTDLNGESMLFLIIVSGAKLNFIGKLNVLLVG